MAEAEDLLVHVRQRLDALTYDEHSQYLLGSLQASSFFDSNARFAAHGPGGVTPPAYGFQSSIHGAPRRRSITTGTTVTSRRRKPVMRSWARYVGLTSYYVRFVLLLGTGWFFAMVGIFTFLFALPAAQSDIVMSSTAQMILLLGLYFLGAALGCLAFGVCADHFGRRRVLLAALAEWIVVNALTAAAWNYASFVALRLLAGIGIGGQLCLLVTIALEYTPTRTRGRITVLSLSLAGLGVFAGVGYGQLAIAALGDGGLGWRASYGVLSACAVLYAGVLFLALEESPKYLASVGRTQEALHVLEQIETAHGINRQARVTVPTSLYEPPSHQQQREQQRQHQMSYERYLGGSSSESEPELELELDPDRHVRRGTDDAELRSVLAPSSSSHDSASRANNVQSNVVGPGAARSRSRSRRVTTRRQPSGHNQCVPSSGARPPEPPNDALAPMAGVSFPRALRRRVVVLFTGPLALRTVLIWLFWFVQLMCASAALVTMVLMAGTFVQTQLNASGFGLADQLFWAAMPLPGLLLAASLMELLGRRVTLAAFVFLGGVVMLLAAWLLHLDGEWLAFSLAIGALVFTTAGTIGAVATFTGEQFPLLARALAISCAAGWGHLGMFAGVYLVLRRVMSDNAWTWHDERLMLTVCGGVSLLLLPVVVAMGPETRGRDIDALQWHESSKELQGLVSGAISVTPSGRPESPTPPRSRGQSKASNHKVHGVVRGSEAAIETSSGDDRPLPESPFAMIVAPPTLYSPASAARAMQQSPSAYSSSSCSSSSSSGFWQTRSVQRLRRKVKRAAQAVAARSAATGSGDKSALSRSAGPKLQASSSSKRARGGSNAVRANTLPTDDLDLLDTIVTEHEYRGPRRSGERPEEEAPERRRRPVLDLLEPVLLDWRRSLSNMSLSSRDLSSSSKGSAGVLAADLEAAIAASDASSNDTGRFTIDLDMFDTFTYISTPVLGGECLREPREASSVSSLGSRGR
ncbi:hypothetical protein BBJ28_00017262 [Nothophytophthora sp. Chile5]|nr:hypothetical protein BBJ28_00017262 [Nothophytophthora sp. Chile5]